MIAIPYTTKSGAKMFRPQLAESEMLEGGGRGRGFCLSCGEEADGVEPDARQYRCESCGARRVYGLEELLIMGLLTISGEGEDD